MDKNQDKNIGKKLDGRYEITERIGEGGMADVYRATDVVDNKTVAVKILKKEFAENEEFLRRFRNESKAIAVLNHPNIVKVFDVGFSERIQFIVMEYIDGFTLNEYMEQEGQLSWKDAVHFITQILRALQHAHSKGIVHRDIKPQNIMMLRDGTIKVMDFGIAKFAREDGKTGTDKAIGTVHYISPEQARGGDTDAKSDIYSVGVMLYEMLTGKKPFDSDNPVSIAVMHMQQQVPLPDTINPDIQIGLEEIILKAMEKNPEDRYQNVREMTEDLKLFKENPEGVFGYYPELFGGEPVDAQEPDMQDEMLNDADFYDDEQQYYEDEAYEGSDRFYDEEEDDDDYEEESKSLFIPVLSAVIIVVILVAGVLFTTAIWDMIKGNTSANRNLEMRMPGLIGMDYEEAKLQYGDQIQIVVESREYSEYDHDKIFDQDIPEGDPVAKGDTVNVKVSLGSKKVQLPDVSGWDFETAKNQIQSNNLYVDKRSKYSDEIPEGKVISTDPVGPIELEPGTYVRVTVSLGKNKNTVPVPNFVGMTWDLARTTAEGMGLVLAKNEVDDSTPEGTVLKQNVKVGEEVSEDSVIELDVSTGKQKDQPVRISFTIPANASGMFHIVMYEGGIAKDVGSTFNPEYAAGITSLTVEGTDISDMVAILVNDQTGAEATIGSYRVDFKTASSQMMSGDITAAFQAVGALGGGAVQTTAPQQTEAVPQTTAPQQTEANQDPSAEGGENDG
ncbi:MAG: Stk1 family PASTA domain-containing Ser/Thr kinase [Oscillospiraceae bacterium]|nr:Stk1 family PASTA domain-containing Ser/Thr kinase [Oscillospiraceae bacterium]